MVALLEDVRFGARMLRRNPAHSFIVVATLAVGIAACTLVFGIVNAVLYRPFDAYRDPGRLVLLYEQNVRQNVVGPASPANVADWQRAARSFEQMGAIGPASMTMIGGGEPETLFGGAVTEKFVRLIDARARCGRVFAARDYLSGASPVVLLADGLWQRRFGGSCDVVGRSLSLNGRPMTVVGVLARDVTIKPLIGVEPQMLVPLRLEGATDRGSRSVLAVGRLRPGTTIAQADAEMRAIARRLAASDAANLGWTVYVKAARGLDLRGDAGFVVVLGVGVAFVLLIVCANVASLLLARASARTKEIATRLAIGAGRWRIVRQILTEVSMLGLAGSAGALLLAYWACRILAWRMSGTNIGWVDVQVDVRVLAFATIVSLGTTVLAGLAPAFRLARAPVLSGLKDHTPGEAGVSPGRLRTWLVAGEIALALVLLAGSGLVLKGVIHLRQNDPGFRTDGLVAAWMTLSDGRYERAEAKAAFAGQVLARLQNRGDVAAVTISSFVPMAGAEVPVSPFVMAGQAQPTEKQPSAGVISASAGYFQAMGIPVSAGRGFDGDDRAGTLPVAVVNERLMRRWFDGRSPIGTQIEVAGIWRTVVGVAGDVRNFHLNVAPAPTIYVPFAQRPDPLVVVLARTKSADPQPMAAAIKAEVRAIDANQPVRGGQSMQQIIERSMGGFDMTMMVVAVLAVVALALAAVGVYGVVAYSVARRTREIGIRVALGATPRQVVGQVLGGGLWLALIGGVPGLLLAGAVGRLLASKLHRVSPVDPAVFVSVPLILVATVLLASYVPARRAARVDPVVATRTE